MEAIPTIFAVLFAMASLAGAGMDIAVRRIPNTLCLTLLVVGLGYAVWSGGWEALLLHSLFTAIALVVGMGLFALRWIGAGDAKFFAGCAAWFRLDQAWTVLFAVSLAGLGLFVGWFIYRRIRGLPISRAASSPHDQLPYGVAIAAGMIASLVLLT